MRFAVKQTAEFSRAVPKLLPLMVISSPTAAFWGETDSITGCVTLGSVRSATGMLDLFAKKAGSDCPEVVQTETSPSCTFVGSFSCISVFVHRV